MISVYMERAFHGRCVQCEPYWGVGVGKKIAEWIGQVIGLVILKNNN